MILFNIVRLWSLFIDSMLFYKETLRMRILIVRHGDPDYDADGLTPDGKIEAGLLAKRMASEKIDRIYVSPLGRAQETAAPVLKALKMTADVRDWMEEFPVKMDITGCEELIKAYPDTPVKDDGSYEDRIVWDCLPSAWKNQELWYREYGWKESLQAEHSDMETCYERVCKGLDELLAENGYTRCGRYYAAEKGNEDTILLVCHFGVTCVMLSHLWGISPMLLWHSLVTLPTSVTEIYTEEREKGIVNFRATYIGDTSHLREGGRVPSFSARFCETYENTDQRH